LLEGVSFILDVHGFELHKRVTPPRDFDYGEVEACLVEGGIFSMDEQWMFTKRHQNSQ
jgi:hypothetical protein